jgi:hypothetical protein
MFLDLKNNLKSSGSLLYKCSISYGTLKGSFASRILTATSGPRSPSIEDLARVRRGLRRTVVTSSRCPRGSGCRCGAFLSLTRSSNANVYWFNHFRRSWWRCPGDSFVRLLFRASCVCTCYQVLRHGTGQDFLCSMISQPERPASYDQMP